VHLVIVAALLLAAAGLVYFERPPYVEGASYSARTRYVLDDGTEVTGTERITITGDLMTYTATENWGDKVRHVRVSGEVLYANRWELRWRITDYRDSDPGNNALLRLGGEDLFLGRQVSRQKGSILREEFVADGSDKLLCYYVATVDRFRCLSRAI
jgi:hypothetical protein